MTIQTGTYRAKDDHSFTVEVTRVTKTLVEYRTPDLHRMKPGHQLRHAIFLGQFEPVPVAPVLGWDNLIDEETGEVKVWVMTAMARRYAMGQWGEITPKTLRDGLDWVQQRVPTLQERWKRAHGIAVGGAPVSGLEINDGFGREA